MKALATVDSCSLDRDTDPDAIMLQAPLKVLGDLGDRAWSQAVGENNEDSFNVWRLGCKPAHVSETWDAYTTNGKGSAYGLPT